MLRVVGKTHMSVSEKRNGRERRRKGVKKAQRLHFCSRF